MKFGPFSETNARQIERMLTDMGVAFTREHSEEDVEGWREQDRARVPAHYSNFQGVVENIVIEIADSDLQQIGDRLEAYGIVLAGDGEEELGGPEDYLCPRCDFSSSEQRLCPRHRMPLVTFSEKVELTKERSSNQEKVFRVLFMIALALAAASALSFSFLKQ